MQSSPRTLSPATTQLTAEVVASFADAPDRLRTVLTALVDHLHAFTTDVQLTHQEWSYAIDFITRLGQACTDVRQEVILMSDVLGLSMLLEILHGDPDDARATEATVLGPFHMTESPARENGDSIDLQSRSTQLVVRGQVTDVEGNPLMGATVDVWQADDAGFYDVQVPDLQPAGNGRGLFTTDDEGRFWFVTVPPAHYPIPTDGPVGELLTATNRHPYRPAHIHFIADAVGHQELITHIFLADSPFLDSDAVFAVRDSLITAKHRRTDAVEAEPFGVRAPFELCDVRLVLDRNG